MKITMQTAIALISLNLSPEQQAQKSWHA